MLTWECLPRSGLMLTGFHVALVFIRMRWKEQWLKGLKRREQKLILVKKRGAEGKSREDEK